MDFWKDKQPLFVVIPVDILTSFNFGKDYWLSSLNWKEFPFAFRSLIPGQGLNVRSVVIRNKGFWAMRNQSMLDPFIMVGFWERSFYLPWKQRQHHQGCASHPCSPVLRFKSQMFPCKPTLWRSAPHLLVLIWRLWHLEKVGHSWQRRVTRGKTLKVISAPDSGVLSASWSIAMWPAFATLLLPIPTTLLIIRTGTLKL